MMASGRLSIISRQLGTATAKVFKAAECQQLKQPLVLITKQREQLEDNEIRIRNRACGLNFATYLSTRGEYQVKFEPPFIPGTEICGEVTEIGREVTAVTPGDVVIGLVESNGLQEELTCPEFMFDMGAVRKVSLDSEKPVDYAKLAGVAVNYGTAWMALTRKGLIKEGDTVLVTGASGGVGLAAVELASKIYKCEVIAVCRNSKRDQVMKYGAKHTIDYATQNIRSELKSLLPGGVDIVFDAVGGDTAVDLVKALAFEGRYITIGYTAGIPKIPANILLLKSASAVGLWWGNTMMSAPEAFRESVDTVLNYYLEGRIDPLIQEAMPLDKVNDAFERIASRQVVGKLVITM